MMISHVIAIAAGLILDRLIGDPRNWPHPVKWFGSLIALLDRHWNKGTNQIGKGTAMLFVVLIVTAAVSITILYLASFIHPAAVITVEAIMIWASIAPRSLKEAGVDVYKPLMDGDMNEARLKLSWIVGRDTDNLDEGEITRGAVETVAENTSDGVIAPLFWAMIGGGPAALLYRAVNTCDSMVGYRNDKYELFGKASARFDDIVNFIPARLTALLLIAAADKPADIRRYAWRIVKRDAKKHPSPNSGWCEAAVAGLLQIELGGLNTYKGIVSDRARMGDPIKERRAEHIIESAKLMERATYLFVLLFLAGVIFYEFAITRSESFPFI
ncbi:adenosylcobinamide-phosphate synthase CbiB [Domibacillus epiphyticus]|uniref:Cobalamin biosynthesis protein CobD n=1 Tax=Domibacillus epiphyticus TaxID=1714355 RepID=A0A1V2ABB4_9BACI|nr:adenosylcobinamide-phosphate synthase CbiB [Domibacillus epiphyticus]OMP68084.1 cobalamin biosynthesis protein CobD [Domibacillus epiphyticus]